MPTKSNIKTVVVKVVISFHPIRLSLDILVLMLPSELRTLPVYYLCSHQRRDRGHEDTHIVGTKNSLCSRSCVSLGQLLILCCADIESKDALGKGYLTAQFFVAFIYKGY